MNEKRPGQKENKSSVFCQRIFLTTETVTFHIINLLLFFQEKLVTSMSREDIDLVANSEDAVSINFFFNFSMVFKNIINYEIIFMQKFYFHCISVRRLLQIKSNYAGVSMWTSIAV